MELSKGNQKNRAKEIILTVCRILKVGYKEIIGPIRKREITEPRFIAMWFIKNRTNLSLKEIGGLFSDRDHSTVIHAVKEFGHLNESNIPFQKKVSKVKQIIDMLTLDNIEKLEELIILSKIKSERVVELKEFLSREDNGGNDFATQEVRDCEQILIECKCEMKNILNND